MNILVTGGAGFIGSWVSSEYLKDGHNVVIVDNLYSGIKENVPEEADFIECDIKNRSDLEEIFRKFKPEIVNHHASQINVRDSVERPAFDAETNIIGSINILELSVKYNVERFIFSSTGGAIYGEPENVPVSENTVQSPLSPYGVSKLSVENYIKYYNRIYSLNYVILRYSNVYGQRQNPHGEAGVVAIFCTNILNKKPCIVFGGGLQTRDYVHVADVAAANLLSLKSKSGIYNIGTSIETSVNDIISSLKNITGNDFTIIYEKERPGEVNRISLKNDFAKENLGWSPEFNFEKGLEQTWNWFRETHQKQTIL
ncbi:MAG: NAD-dependent epimerase/dehydratase family protein [Thermodesulfobacteriota bacterium]